MAITAMLTGWCPLQTRRSLPVKPRVELIEYDSVYLQNKFIVGNDPRRHGRIVKTFLPNKRDMLIPFIGRKTSIRYFQDTNQTWG